MRIIEIEELKEGMKLAKTVYDDTGRVLLSVGTELTERYIRKLSSFGMPFIYIEDELIGPMDIEDIIHDRVRIQTVKALQNVVDSARMRSELDFRPISVENEKISAFSGCIVFDYAGRPGSRMQQEQDRRRGE